MAISCAIMTAGPLATVKAVHIEIYAEIDLVMQGITYQQGSLAVFISKAMLETRVAAGKDAAHRVQSGSISNVNRHGKIPMED